MQLGRVDGVVTATVKHESLRGWRLLIVQPFDAVGGDLRDPVVAIDELGADRGDRVILSSDGKRARELLRSETAPVRMVVQGIVDRIDIEADAVR